MSTYIPAIDRLMFKYKVKPTTLKEKIELSPTIEAELIKIDAEIAIKQKRLRQVWTEIRMVLLQ